MRSHTENMQGKVHNSKYCDIMVRGSSIKKMTTKID